MQYVGIEVLEGKYLRDVIVGGDYIVFETDDGETYRMEHFQDCCESVYIESISGDVKDLIGARINLAQEVSDEAYEAEKSPPTEYYESYTWTFYKLATYKGYVDIRWYGESNGYYSERVDFYKV